MRKSSSVKTIKVSFDAVICISAGGDTCRQISRRIFRVLCIAQKLKGVMSGGYDIIRRKVVHSKNRNRAVAIQYILRITTHDSNWPTAIQSITLNRFNC